MNISAGSIVPPAVVLAVAGWSCWTILGAAPPPPAAKPKPAASAAALLEPDLGAEAPRDPFMVPGEPPPTAKGAAAAKPAEGPEAKLRRLLAAGIARLAAARAAEAKKAAAREKLTHMALSGTSIHGDRRTAIIGGRAYSEGEAIEGTEPSLGPVILAEVRAKEVTLRSAAGPVAVKFADTSAHSASAAPTPPPQAAAAARRPRSNGGARTIRGKAR